MLHLVPMPSAESPRGSSLPPIAALVAAGVRRSSGPSARGGSDRASTRAGAERRLLLVEDNPADVNLVREALGALPCKIDISTAHDGEQALSALWEAAQQGIPPDVIFLDLNLPRRSGHEVLAQLKADRALSNIPVVVLTSSSSNEDSEESYRLHADEFVTKPMDVCDYFQIIQATARLWLQIA